MGTIMIFDKGLSIEIGNYHTKIVLYKTIGSATIIEKSIVFRTPEDAVEDGKILLAREIAKKISEELSKHSIKVKDATFTISGTSIITREIVLPKVKNRDLKAMIEISASDYLPINLTNYILDFKVLKEIQTEGIKQLKALLVAAPIGLIEQYVKLSEMCGLNIVEIDYAGNSFYKVLTKELEWRKVKNNLKAKTYAIIDIGSKTTSITIIADGSLEFNRNLLYGSKDIDVAISQRCGIDEDEAERFKQSNESLYSDGQSANEDMIIRDSIKTVLITMTEDISRFFEYYISRKTGNTIDMIFTTGYGSQLKGLEEYFQNAFSTPACKLERFNFVRVKNKESMQDKDFLTLGTCIGAAL